MGRPVITPSTFLHPAQPTAPTRVLSEVTAGGQLRTWLPARYATLPQTRLPCPLLPAPRRYSTTG